MIVKLSEDDELYVGSHMCSYWFTTGSKLKINRRIVNNLYNFAVLNIEGTSAAVEAYSETVLILFNQSESS